MSHSPHLLIAKQLCAERGGRALFEHVSISLSAGELLALRGPNGTGKTTLLRLLAGLGAPEHGEIARNAPILFWGHAAAIKDELTPIENLKLMCASESVSETALTAALDLCGLGKRRYVLARKLSAGQRRRIGLAWLTLASAKVWLLDEPTTALDAAGLGLLVDVLNAHQLAGGAAIVATHQDIAGLHTPPRLLELGQ